MISLVTDSSFNFKIQVNHNNFKQFLSHFTHYNAIKAALADLYNTLYGYNKPKCLRNTTKQTLKIGNMIEAIEPIMEIIF
jgi:hypothetical protein